MAVKINRFNKFSYTILASAISLSLTVSAEENSVEEKSSAAKDQVIVVTSQRRQQSITDVPIAISALTGDELSANGISDTDDIVNAFPNLGTNVRSAYNSGVSIRGVGTDNFHISGQQSVGTYIDDVSMVSPFISTIGIYDMDRVEVLRGPQNTLYGRNTTGGAIVWHTKKASVGEGTNGYGSVGIGSGGLREMEAAVGFDMSQNVAGRIAVMNHDYDGLWTDVVTGKDTGGGYDRFGARLNLQWEISADTSMNIGLSTGSSDGEDNAYTYRGNYLANGELDPNYESYLAESYGRFNSYVRVGANQVDANSYLSNQFLNNTGMVIVNPQPGPFNRLINYSTEFGQTYVHPEAGFEADWNGLRLNLTHAFDKSELSVLAAYDETELFAINIADLTGFANGQAGDWEVMQLELRLASTDSSSDLQWMTGLYYSTEDSTQDTWVQNGGAAGGQGVAPGIDIDSEYNNVSVYGQIDYKISEALNLTAGLRFTDDELSAAPDGWRRTVCGFSPTLNGISTWTRDVRANGCPGFVGPGGSGGQRGPISTQSPKQELSKLGSKLGLDYKLTESSMIYASWSRGFKGGAYDNRPLATGENPIGPETLTALELGFKSKYLDNQLHLTGAVFSYDWEGLQLFDVISNAPALLNIPETELVGAEIEAKYYVNDSWFLQMAIGTVDTEITNVDGIPTESSATKGDEVSNTPDLTANMLATYTTELDSGNLSFTVSWRYASDYYYNFTQTPGRKTAPSQDYLNANMSYQFGDQSQYTLRLYGKNLTDEFHCSGLQDGPAGGQNYSCRVGSFGEAEYGLNFRVDY